jgi:hypothetical protein
VVICFNIVYYIINTSIFFNYQKDIHPGSTSHILEMLHPLLENQKKISSEFRQLEALHELRQAGVALPEKYQQILDRELQLKTSMSKQPQHIKRLISKKFTRSLQKIKNAIRSMKSIKKIVSLLPIFVTALICNLFVDIGNFKGGGARGRVSQLSELLENYKDVQNLIEFFERP